MNAQPLMQRRAAAAATRAPRLPCTTRVLQHNKRAGARGLLLRRSATGEQGDGKDDETRSAAAAAAGPDSGSSPSTSSSSSSTSTSTSAAATTTTATAGEEMRIAGAERSDLQIPRDVVESLKFSVFGYDTLWVTSVDNYGSDGVVFKGNLRAKDAQAAYDKMASKLRTALGDDWQIFLVEDKDEKPTAVVLPATAREGELSRFTEVWLTVAFGAATLVTTMSSAGVPALQFLVDPFRTAVTPSDVVDALPLAGAFLATLLAHELGHRAAASRRGVQLYLPLLVPAGFGFLGSFGAITRFRGFAPDRAALLDVAASGPAAGAAVSGAMLLAGLALSSAGLGDVTIDSVALADSWSVALLSQLALGDALANPEVRVSSLLVAGWAGLAVNALNCLPTGELDGGRIALGLFGRRGYTALGVLTIAALAISSFSSTLAGYWVLFVLALQRGPALPCRQEVAPPADEGQRRLGLALLALPLLVLPPLPVDLILAFKDLGSPSLF